jgi:hypothetical protein
VPTFSHELIGSQILLACSDFNLVKIGIQPISLIISFLLKRPEALADHLREEVSIHANAGGLAPAPGEPTIRANARSHNMKKKEKTNLAHIADGETHRVERRVNSIHIEEKKLLIFNSWFSYKYGRW